MRNTYLNIAVAVFLLAAFAMAAQTVWETMPVANMAALVNLRPQPMDYLWDVNLHQAPADVNQLRLFADYYEHLLNVFPELRETYGLLGYCYHYFNNDRKAMAYLKRGIQYNPENFWNYYNLAAIDINQGRYAEAEEALKKGLKLDPAASLKKMLTSTMVYLPLMRLSAHNDFKDMAVHLQKTYQSCFFLVQVLDQAQAMPEMREKLKEVRLELYAF